MRLPGFADSPDDGAPGATVHRQAWAAPGSRSASLVSWSLFRSDSNLPLRRLSQPLCSLLELYQPGLPLSRGVALMSGLVRGLILARGVRASLRHHIVQTLTLDCRPLIDSLLGLYRDLQKLDAGAFRRVGETSGSPAAGKSDAGSEYPLHARYHNQLLSR